MKYYFAFFLVLIAFVGYVSQASAQESSGQEYGITIEGGDITKVTYNFKSSSIKIQVEMEKEGP